ncbi:MAG TPA: lipid-A-disaccharide synthase [Syntrophorhabdaceae bacterium]|nr:lipid-A-disaccharide synthase [Syntrophorhabdaceae bacterium]HQM82703.1 lipid-A-disaccharide synthase [Syntrophorhabdaceae bacterium]
MLHIVLVTGELSGEMHAVELVRSIKGSVAVELSGIGGQRLRDAGMHTVYDYRDISLTGLSEIFSKLRHIADAYKILKRHLEKTRPSLLILVDFPGFNLKIARLARSLSIPTIYFIPPQIWAWRKKRVLRIKQYVDKVISVLPFERQIYEEYGVDASYVGHPFASTLRPSNTKEDFFKKTGIGKGCTVVTIMPGSRENEIRRHMPVLLKSVEKIKGRVGRLAVLLPLADNIDASALDRFREGLKDCTVIRGQSCDALAYSDLAIVSSGSATLEAAILGTPTIVIYRISRLSYSIARMVVKIKHISLPNIIAGKEVFPEFVQRMPPEKIAEKALYMINNGKDSIKKDTDEILARLGRYDSYERAKDIVVEFLEKRYGPLPQTP